MDGAGWRAGAGCGGEGSASDEPPTSTAATGCGAMDGAGWRAGAGCGGEGSAGAEPPTSTAATGCGAMDGAGWRAGAGAAAREAPATSRTRAEGQDGPERAKITGRS